MGVILAIAFDLASGDGGRSATGLSASLFLATLASVGLWLWGRWRAQSPAGTAGWNRSPGFVARVAPRLAGWQRLWPTPPVTAAATVVLPPYRADAFSPDRRRARPPWPNAAALSSSPGVPPAPHPDSHHPPHEPIPPSAR